MQLQKINNIKVKPLIGGSIDIEKIRGNKLFPSKNPAIFLLGKRMSGKTSTIGEILKKCAGKKSTIHFYVSTIYQDDTYKEIIKMLKNKGITNIEKNTNIDNLAELVNELELKYKEDDDEEEDAKGSGKKEKQLQMKYIMVDEDEEEEEKKERKDRMITPPHIFIFDDMSHALRSPIIAKLLKNGRHFCMILLSSQNLNDLLPESILQLNYCLMFPQIPKEKLLETHRKMDLAIPVNKFLELYYFATNEPYHFLYVSSKGTFRKDFNYEFKDF